MKSRQKTKFLSIAIAAYNASKNIRPLVKSLISQKGFNAIVKELVVYSDASKDNTVELARNIKHPAIKVIDSAKNGGFAASIIKIFKLLNNEYVLLLNDDIRIKDGYFLKKLIKPLLIQNIDLLTGNPRPIPANNFIGKASYLSFTIFERMRQSLKNKNNKFTCDGKIMLLSKRFIKSMKFPKNLAEMGNVDAFFYFSCIENNFIYRFNKNAEVVYNYPSSVNDYVKWQVRNNSNAKIMQKRFGTLVKKEFKLPKKYFSFLTLNEIVSNLDSVLFLIFLHFYVLFKIRNADKWFKPKWEVITTTK